MKEALMSWVSAQRDLDPTSKFLLHRLALYADAEGCAWCSVPTLAAECNVSERTVQYKMRAMEEGGKVAKTGRTHRQGTRHIPILQLAPNEGFWAGTSGSKSGREAPSAAAPEVVEEPARMGAKSAPMQVCADADLHPYGCNCLHPYKDMKREEEGVYTPSLGAGAREAAFQEVLGEWLAGSRNSRTDEVAARGAWRTAVLDHEPAQLVAAARRALAEDPDFRRRGPIGLHRWLLERRFLAWLGPATGLRGSASGEARWSGPSEVRAAVVAQRDEAFAASYLDPSAWDGGRILTRTGFAAAKLAALQLDGVDGVEVRA